MAQAQVQASERVLSSKWWLRGRALLLVTLTFSHMISKIEMGGEGGVGDSHGPGLEDAHFTSTLTTGHPHNISQAHFPGGEGIKQSGNHINSLCHKHYLHIQWTSDMYFTDVHMALFNCCMSYLLTTRKTWKDAIVIVILQMKERGLETSLSIQADEWPS